MVIQPGQSTGWLKSGLFCKVSKTPVIIISALQISKCYHVSRVMCAKQ